MKPRDEATGNQVKVCDRPEDIYKGSDIVAALTDSAVPVLDATMLEPGAHIVNIGRAMEEQSAH